MLLILVLAAGVMSALAAAETVLVDETVGVPRSQYRVVRLTLVQRPAVVVCEFVGVEGGAVRALMMTAADLERLRRGEAYRLLAASAAEKKGQLRYRVNRPGEYALLLENSAESRAPARVKLKVGLRFTEETSFAPRVLSPEERRRIVAASLAGFAVVAGLACWRLVGAVRRRQQRLPEFPV
jgi:hypothetical protein